MEAWVSPLSQSQCAKKTEQWLQTEENWCYRQLNSIQEWNWKRADKESTCIIKAISSFRFKDGIETLKSTMMRVINPRGYPLSVNQTWINSALLILKSSSGKANEIPKSHFKTWKIG